MTTIGEKVEELKYLKSLSFCYNKEKKPVYVDVYSNAPFGEQLREYSASELELKGNMICIKIPSRAPIVVLKDKVHQIIKKNKVDADAFIWTQCNCGLETIVQLLRTSDFQCEGQTQKF